MIEIISHRGLWNDQISKNSIESFQKSFQSGFGTETDIRDHCGKIVISHDMPGYSKKHIYFETFLQLYKQSNLEVTLALNVKSDGLCEAVKSSLKSFQIENYFLFDMSVPDQLQYLNCNLNTYSRLSEHEKNPVFYDSINGIWLDAFETIWYNEEIIRKNITQNKKVCVVSSELHKRNHIELWEFLKLSQLHTLSGIILCTDLPIQAKHYFYE
mgnify:CR=1 FL=1